MSRTFGLIKNLLRLFAKLLGQLHVGPASPISEDQFDYHTINISTR
ncbi:MAG: hypothetical protein P8046_01365 [Anaerolineales bacterium]|jgi:hypothetical protein